MNAPDLNWEPDPQWLAAYFDGELEGRADLLALRARIEAWLETHPEALGECAELQSLQKLWFDTTPVEPSRAAWQRCRAAIDADRARTKSHAPSLGRRGLALGGVAAGIVLFVGVLFGAWRWSQATVAPAPHAVAPSTEGTEIFEVAQASEITILRVEGADTGAFVVGVPPLVGLLELADPGDVDVLHMCPDARDQMLPNVREQGRPLIWARIDVDD